MKYLILFIVFIFLLGCGLPPTTVNIPQFQWADYNCPQIWTDENDNRSDICFNSIGYDGCNYSTAGKYGVYYTSNGNGMWTYNNLVEMNKTESDKILEEAREKAKSVRWYNGYEEIKPIFNLYESYIESLKKEQVEKLKENHDLIHDYAAEIERLKSKNQIVIDSELIQWLKNLSLGHVAVTYFDQEKAKRLLNQIEGNVK
jgi:hypothetical protein